MSKDRILFTGETMTPPKGYVWRREYTCKNEHKWLSPPEWEAEEIELSDGTFLRRTLEWDYCPECNEKWLTGSRVFAIKEKEESYG